jgi:hypothetical protein
MSEVQQGFEFKREFQITLRASDFRFVSTFNKETSWVREYPASVAESSPSMYLRLNEQSGTTASDSSGFNRSGTYENSPTPSGAGGVDGGRSYDFDGTNDYVSTSYNPFVASGACTLEAWVNRDTNTSLDTIFGASGADRPSIKMGANNDTMIVNVNNSASVSFTSTGIGTASWKHVAVTFEAAGANYVINLYVNGVAHASNPQTASGTWVTPGTLMIGALGAGSDFFDGKIAEAAVYSKVLSASAILSHYRAATGYFQNEVFMTNVNNSGSYYADPIIKIEGPINATASGATAGLTIENKYGTNYNVTSSEINSYSTTADSEINGLGSSSKFSVNLNNKTLINPKSSDNTSPYEIIGSGEYILINTRDRTINFYDADDNQFLGSGFSQLNKDSEWIKIGPGENPLYITCTENSNPTVTIYFRDTFI